MDYLWTPWRYRYIADAKKDEGCIFCDALAAKDDAKTLIVFRGRKNFIILNRLSLHFRPRDGGPLLPLR